MIGSMDCMYDGEEIWGLQTEARQWPILQLCPDIGHRLVGSAVIRVVLAQIFFVYVHL